MENNLKNVNKSSKIPPILYCTEKATEPNKRQTIGGGGGGSTAKLAVKIRTITRDLKTTTTQQ